MNPNLKGKTNIAERVLAEANYMIKTGKTIREIANIFKVSKSTVHKDLHERLIDVNYNLHQEVDKILKDHIKTRHLRGGESTKKKYLNIAQ